MIRGISVLCMYSAGDDVELISEAPNTCESATYSLINNTLYHI